MFVITENIMKRPVYMPKSHGDTEASRLTQREAIVSAAKGILFAQFVASQ
jgi:hypothetical protein